MTTIGAGTPPPVAIQVVRSGVVESVHRAHIAVVSPQGQIVAHAGDPTVTMLPRSSLKPLIAVALLELGMPMPRPELLALVASSHSGEQFHCDAARELLVEAELPESALANTADWPFEQQVREQWIAAGGSKDQIHANCSGKHAGMLRTCRARGWPVDGYLDPHHPLTQQIAVALAGQIGQEVGPGAAIDGCGAPVWAMPLAGLARGFARLATSAAGRAVSQAMRAHPEYVGGSHRDVTALMRAVPGLVAKDGADGVYAAALPDGRGVAIKVEDGSARARPAVIAGTLAALGIDADALAPIGSWETVSGGGHQVGELQSVVVLTADSPRPT